MAAYRALRRRLVLVAACTLIVPAAALPLFLSGGTDYSATAAVAIGTFSLTPEAGRVAELDSHYVVSRGMSVEGAPVPHAWLRSVDTRVARRLPSLNTAQVADRVEPQLNANARRIEIVATTGSSRGAARLANAYAEEYVALDRAGYQAQVNSAEATVKLQTDIARRNSRAPGPRLRREAEELAILKQTGPRPLQLVARAKPPRHAAGLALWHELFLGALAGFMIGVTTAVALDRLRGPPPLPAPA